MLFTFDYADVVVADDCAESLSNVLVDGESRREGHHETNSIGLLNQKQEALLNRPSHPSTDERATCNGTPVGPLDSASLLSDPFQKNEKEEGGVTYTFDNDHVDVADDGAADDGAADDGAADDGAAPDAHVSESPEPIRVDGPIRVDEGGDLTRDPVEGTAGDPIGGTIEGTIRDPIRDPIGDLIGDHTGAQPKRPSEASATSPACLALPPPVARLDPTSATPSVPSVTASADESMSRAIAPSMVECFLSAPLDSPDATAGCVPLPSTPPNFSHHHTPHPIPTIPTTPTNSHHPQLGLYLTHVG